MRQFAKGRPRREPGTMNGLEKRYAEHLESQKKLGRVVDYVFEGCRLKLAKLTYYTPDFMVLMDDMTIEFHEAKGHWEDDARVKIKVAAETYPHFKFLAVKAVPKKHGGGWRIEEF